MQILMDLGIDLTVWMLKASSYGVNFHINNLPLFVHHYAVHAAFPELQDAQSLKLDCQQHTMHTITAALLVLQRMPVINRLEIVNNSSSQNTPTAKSPALQVFGASFQRFLQLQLLELVLHFSDTSGRILESISLPDVLQALTVNACIRKLSLESSFKAKDTSFSAICDMNAQLTVQISKLTSLESLTLVKTCSLEWLSRAGTTAHSILQLHNLTELHFDTGGLDEMAAAISTLHSAPKNPPRSKSQQATILNNVGYTFVNMMGEISSAPYCFNLASELSSPPPCSRRLQVLTLDGYLNGDSQEKDFNKGLCHFRSLHTLRILHGDGLRGYFSYSRDSFLRCIARPIQLMTNLRTLHLLENSESSQRDWLLASRRDFQALQALPNLQCLQSISISFVCNKAPYKELIDANCCFTSPSLTSLTLKLTNCSANTAIDFLGPVSSLIALKHFSVTVWENRGCEGSHSVSPIMPALQLYALQNLESLEVMLGGERRSHIGIPLAGLSNLTKLHHFALAGEYGEAVACRMFSELSACSSLRSLHALEVYVRCRVEQQTFEPNSLFQLPHLTELRMENKKHGFESTSGSIPSFAFLTTKNDSAMDHDCKDTGSLKLQKLHLQLKSMACFATSEFSEYLWTLTSTLIELKLICAEDVDVLNQRREYGVVSTRGFPKFTETPHSRWLLLELPQLVNLQHLDMTEVHMLSEQTVIDVVNKLGKLPLLEWLGLPLSESVAEIQDNKAASRPKWLDVDRELMISKSIEDFSAAEQPIPGVMISLRYLPALKHLKLSVTYMKQKVEGLAFLLAARTCIRDISFCSRLHPLIPEKEKASICDVLQRDPTRCRELLRLCSGDISHVALHDSPYHGYF